MRCQRSGVMVRFLAQLSIKPCMRQIPFALHGTQRDLQRLGNLCLAQAAEEAQFDDAALALVELCQSVERVSSAITSALRSSTRFSALASDTCIASPPRFWKCRRRT